MTFPADTTSKQIFASLIANSSTFVNRAKRCQVSHWLAAHSEQNRLQQSAIQKWIAILSIPTFQKPYFSDEEREELLDLIQNIPGTVHISPARRPRLNLRILHQRELTFDEWMIELEKYLHDYISFEGLNWSQITKDLQKILHYSERFDFAGLESVEELQNLLARASSWYHMKEGKPQPPELRKLATVLAFDVVKDAGMEELTDSSSHMFADFVGTEAIEHWK